MHLPSLDLNLIVVLHALLEERNVTRAGERLGMSQPGTSAALGRLRRHFNDPLLQREGGQYVLTPLAQGLYDQLGRMLDDLQRLLDAQPRFDAAAAERRFVVQCSDAVLSVLGPRLVAAVARAAPGVSLDFRGIDQAVVNDPLTTLRDIDVLIAPRGLFSVPEALSAELYSDRWICVTWRGNHSVADRLTREDAARARWVMPFRQPLMASPADAGLAALGIDRHCAVRVENFAVLGRLVVGTDLLVLCHERLIRRHPDHQLRDLDLPSALPPFTETAWWHPVRQLDPGHRWFIDLLIEQGRALQGEPDGSSGRAEP
ncbi:LysR family transcriptional regulator [Actinomadura sp. NBRC 104425]|uniref:LysR family transcriptional regulator n=1 Tax=Actinomadura sp. NBRC 104425 TaxID=3032204 RepID=UPI0024A19E9C|nr:LysR family transcriptional regulator [Actinomadura sp. NBRC 104425]GLZ12016.1 LysR family transcriptional regulator [Actinomadura sp. NBRC 104425]